MSAEGEIRHVYVDYIPTTIAGIIFALQFMIFMYNFNFQGIIVFKWMGWLLLLPGFLLISISRSNHTNEASYGELRGRKYLPCFLKPSYNFLLRHSLFVGWFMMSVALAMISQDLFGIFFMGLQLPLIAFSIYIGSASDDDSYSHL